MGRISERRQASRQQQAAGPQLTELGDPDFSPSQGSQAQVPAAAAQGRVFDNQRRAENQIQQAIEMGYDVSTKDWEKVHQQAETGFIEEDRGVIGSLVGWVDGPRQAINLLIQDLAGGEAGEGFRNPNFGDYWNTMWGGLEDEEGFRLETGLSPISGSKTLDMFGWAEAEDDDFLGRAVRGIADLGLQVATDPLTYVTFGLSGLGKKVALQAGRSMQSQSVNRIMQVAKGAKKVEDLTPYEKLVYSQLDETVNAFQGRLTEKAGSFGGELPAEMQEALGRYLGEGEDVWGNITELALANRVHDDVIRPLMSRRFKDIDSLALDMLPAYAKGGARISVPFTRKSLEHGMLIPGTQGLGRKLVGDPMRKLSEGLKHFGPYEHLADGIKKGTSKMDQMAPLLRALRDGDIEGWQWHVAATAIDNMHNNVARHTISTELNSQWNRISELAKTGDVDLDIIGADILARLEGDNVSDELLKQMGRPELLDGEFGYRQLNPQLAASVDETITYMQQVMNSYHEALGALDPEFAERFITGYIPHSPTKEARKLINALSGTTAGDSGQGDPAMDLFAQVLNAAGRGGKAEPNMGTVRHIDRKVGKVATLTDDGPINIKKDALRELGETQPFIDEATGAVNPNAVQTRYLSTTKLNELLEPIVRRLAHENGVPIPANWDGKIFNENPIATMIDYVDNMTDAIQAWQTVDSLKASGLAFKHQTELDVQQVVQNVFNNAVRNVSTIETTKFGRPTPGQTDRAPIGWLERAVDPEDYKGAVADIEGRPRTDGIEGRPHHAGLPDDIAEKGVKQPIKIAILEDGRAIVLDGHHRIAAAKQAGVTDAPVQVVRDSSEVLGDPKYGVDVSDKLKPGWYENDQSAAIYEDIRSNPSRYAFHSTEADKAEQILAGSQRSGGIYADREAAEGFVRHPSAEGAEEVIEEGQRRVLVYDREQLPPSVRSPLEKSGEIGDVRDLPPGSIKPIGSYDPAVGMESFTAKQVDAPVDNLSTYDMHESFDMLPWGPEVREEINLLRGGDKSSIPGVSRSVKQQVDDTGVLVWQTVDDVADTRRVAQKVNSSHYTEWAADAPSPDFGVQHGEETLSHQWRRTVDADGVHHEAFGPEELNDVQKARQASRRKDVKETKKARQAAKNAEGKEPPKLRVQARNASHADGAVLRLTPFEALNRVEANNVRRAAHEWLDRAFREGGALEGMFTDSGIQSLIDSGLDEYTAEILHSYTHTKLNSLGRDAVEFIAKEPAEIFETRKLVNDFMRGLNDFVQNNAAVRNSDGKLIADNDKIRIAGTKEVREQLAGLKRAALKLGSKGYDEAVAIMQDVEAYTGVQKLKGYVTPDHFNLAGPAVEDLTIQANIAEWMSLTARNMGTIYTPEGVAAAKLAANETLKWWRAMATLPRPAFHIRNLVGGSWMNMNMGVTSKSMQRAMQHGMAFRRALANASGPDGIEQAFKALPADMRQAWRAAWDHNVLAGFATTEFSDALTPIAKRKRWDWAKATDVDNFALTRAGGKVMETTEDFMRMSLFLEYYDEAVPGSAKVAADIVNTVHFDYSNLTPTETKLKSIIPFFVWTRRNLPLQISLAVENPRYIQRYRAMMQAMNDNFGGDDPNNLQEADWMTAYAAGTNYKVNENTPFWGRIMIDPDLPIRDLLEIPNPEPGAMIEYANNILGPHISLISDINGQRDFGDVNAPAPLNAVLQSLAAVGMYDRTTDGDVRIPYLMRTLMETAVPFTRDVVDPLTGGSTDPGRQQRQGIMPDDSYVERSMKSVGAMLAGGFGAKLTTPADTRGAAFRSDNELNEVIKSLRLEGKAPPQGG